MYSKDKNVEVKISDSVTAFVDFDFNTESDCDTGYVETLGGPYTVDNWSTYFVLEDFEIQKVLIDNKEVDYQKVMTQDDIAKMMEAIESYGNGIAENMEYDPT